MRRSYLSSACLRKVFLSRVLPAGEESRASLSSQEGQTSSPGWVLPLLAASGAAHNISSKSCSPLEEFQGGRAAQYQDWTREELSPPLSRSNFGLAPPVFTCIARKQCFCVRRMKLLPISFPRLFLPFSSSSQRDSSEWGSVVRLTHGGVL